MIKALRVDHRLLHGQVAVSWTSQLGADCILLASDTVMDDKFRLTSIKLAKPEGVKVVVKNVEDAITALKSGVTDKYKLFIVCECIPDAERIAREVGIKDINLGSTRPEEGKRAISKVVFIDEEDEKRLSGMMDDGIAIGIQMIPTEKNINCRDALKRKE